MSGPGFPAARIDRRERVALVVVHVQGLHVPRRHDVLRQPPDRVAVDDGERVGVDDVDRVRHPVRHVDARRNVANRRRELVGLRELVDVRLLGRGRRRRRRRGRGGRVRWLRAPHLLVATAAARACSRDERDDAGESEEVDNLAAHGAEASHRAGRGTRHACSSRRTGSRSYGGPIITITCSAPASTYASTAPISSGRIATVRSMSAGSRPTSAHQSSSTSFL
jgi:hypothetical protein